MAQFTLSKYFSSVERIKASFRIKESENSFIYSIGCSSRLKFLFEDSISQIPKFKKILIPLGLICFENFFVTVIVLLCFISDFLNDMLTGLSVEIMCLLVLGLLIVKMFMYKLQNPRLVNIRLICKSKFQTRKIKSNSSSP